MSDRYDYHVEKEVIGVYLGRFKYGAKVPYVVKNPWSNSERIDPGFQEHWGFTEEEAECKARAEADRWIAEQHARQSAVSVAR